MTPSPAWYEEKVLQALSAVPDNAGATCQSMSRVYVDFWPLFPLQRLHRMGQVRAIHDGEALSDAAVAELDMIEDADTVTWQLTPAGQERASRLQ